MLLSMEQHQVKLKSEVVYRKGQLLEPLLFLIHISDINYEIADSAASCFADDTRILLGRKDEDYTQMLQNYLHKLMLQNYLHTYKWADKNNMKFNAN